MWFNYSLIDNLYLHIYYNLTADFNVRKTSKVQCTSVFGTYSEKNKMTTNTLIPKCTLL